MIDNKIETEKEFNDLSDIRVTVPNIEKYAPNIYEYKGLKYVYFNNTLYSIDKFGMGTFVEDYFHPKYYIVNNGNFVINTSIKVSNLGRGFDPDDSDTWVRITVNNLIRHSTSDEDLYKSTGQSVYSKYSNGILVLHVTDKYLTDLGFSKGIVNENTWFHESEIDYVDEMLPYRRFNNTYYKVDIDQLKKDLKVQGLSPAAFDKEVATAIKQNILYGVDSPTYNILEGIKYTFGVELETCRGRIEDSEVKNINVKAVHDGSLRDEDGNTPGGEYVSGVLVGDAGLAQVHEICRLLSSKCKVNHQCGVHVHVGNLNWSDEDVVYSYLLAEKLETELYAMLPKSRRNNSYCRSLTPLTLKRIEDLKKANSKSQYKLIIEDIFNDILKEVTYTKGSTGIDNSILSNRSYNKNAQHPLGAKCGYDKNAQRYCWLNYVTLLYNTKGHHNSLTLEFRSHSGTTSYTKIKNWIKICMAFCKYVDNHKKEILNNNVTLNDVLSAVYPKTGQKLINYVEERKEVFKTHGESIDYAMEDHSKKTLKEIICA